MAWVVRRRRRPVIDLTRIVYDTKGRAVEVMLAVIAADTVQLSYRFPIPD